MCGKLLGPDITYQDRKKSCKCQNQHMKNQCLCNYTTAVSGDGKVMLLVAIVTQLLQFTYSTLTRPANAYDSDR